MRGTPVRRPRIEPLFRFIPACAGNTNSLPLLILSALVHPRVCGEHFVNLFPNHFSAGSSPRVRGTQPPPLFPSIAYRFIPACAGNTNPHLYFRSASSVHPRVCGEHRKCHRVDAREFGSSPRVRGTPIICGCGYHCRWFIPACAGNTYYLVRLANLCRFIPACAGNTRA